MAMQKMQQRQLAQIGAAALRFYQDNEKKVAWKYEELDAEIRRVLRDDQLEFEFEVTDEKVKIK